MKKLGIIFGLALLSSCVSTKIGDEGGIPPDMQFEIERIKSPITGEVPSQNRYAYLANEVSNLIEAASQFYDGEMDGYE